MISITTRNILPIIIPVFFICLVKKAQEKSSELKKQEITEPEKYFMFVDNSAAGVLFGNSNHIPLPELKILTAETAYIIYAELLNRIPPNYKNLINLYNNSYLNYSQLLNFSNS